MPRKGERIHTGERGLYYWPRDGGRKQYEITYTDANSEQRWEMLPAGQGIQAARALRGKRMTDGAPPARATRDTFAEVAEAYLAKKKREVTDGTLDGYRRTIHAQLNPRLGRRAIADIDADDIADLVADLRGSRPARARADDAVYSTWSVRSYWTVLRGVFSHARRRKILTEDPCALLEKGERPVAGQPSLRYLDGDLQIRALLNHADDQWRVLFATAIFTGLRIGELLALLWADIDTRAGFVHVRAQLRPTGNRDQHLKSSAAYRDVVLMGSLARALEGARDVRGTTPHPNRPVFASEAGRIPDRTTVRKALKAACAAADLDPLNFHALRHTFASILIVGQHEDVVAVARQLGHAKPSTTLDTYAKLFDRARHADRLRAGLDDQYGGLL